MTVAALISDLWMQSQVRGAAESAGVPVRFAAGEDQLLSKIAEGETRLVIVDLTHPGLNVADVISRAKAALPANGLILAFGPHVHVDRLASAREAGADLVLARGQFHAQLADLLTRHGRTAGD